MGRFLKHGTRNARGGCEWSSAGEPKTLAKRYSQWMVEEDVATCTAVMARGEYIDPPAVFKVLVSRTTTRISPSLSTASTDPSYSITQDVTSSSTPSSPAWEGVQSLWYERWVQGSGVIKVAYDENQTWYKLDSASNVAEVSMFHYMQWSSGHTEFWDLWSNDETMQFPYNNWYEVDAVASSQFVADEPPPGCDNPSNILPEAIFTNIVETGAGYANHIGFAFDVGGDMDSPSLPCRGQYHLMQSTDIIG